MSSSIDELTRHCEQEPLAHSGAIQPHGVLLQISRDTGRILRVSANSQAYLDQTPERLLAGDGLAWLEQLGIARDGLPPHPGQRREYHAVYSGPAGELDLLAIANDQGWLIELEPVTDQRFDLAAARDAQTRLLRAPDGEAAMRVLQDDLVEVMRGLIGFDRVMLYRFHPDWSGEVVAESRSDVYGSYLGLRFPASDIPAIARQLYTLTPYRHIPDVAGQAVRLLGEGGTDVDLTWSDLRSVSPVHLQYLRNMRVGASFSVSILLAGQLWGLIACHHPVPRLLPLGVRGLCAELASGFMLALNAYQAGQRIRLHDQAHGLVDEFLEPLRQRGDLTETVAAHHQELLDLAQASGGALIVGDDLLLYGDAPDAGALDRIDRCFMERSHDNVFSSDHLTALLPGDAIPGCAGLLAIRFKSTRGGAWIRLYWFRPEEPGEVTWAGNPHKPVELSPSGMRFSPRYSFEKWVEIRRGYSAPWSSRDILAATLLRAQLPRWA